MIKLAFYVVMGTAIVLNLVNAALNLPGTARATETHQTPTPTLSPTVTPVPTPCFPDDPKKPCPSPSPTMEPLPTTSPTMQP